MKSLEKCFLAAVLIIGAVFGAKTVTGALAGRADSPAREPIGIEPGPSGGGPGAEPAAPHRPPPTPAAGREVDVEKLRDLIRRKRLSDHEADNYKKLD